MYTYEFEHIRASFRDWNPLDGNQRQTEEHQKIILERARNGWRYVGYIPTRQLSAGYVREMDLIFERELS